MGMEMIYSILYMYGLKVYLDLFELDLNEWFMI